ncbi:MAG: site-specific integrase [Bacteroidales bacterium]|nr:site-specific integrase [Bacteroidales bacterium]
MIKKIRYKLVYNRASCLNQRGEGLIQIEAEQQHRKIYFSTHTYVVPEHFAHGCVVNTKNADGLNFALFSMIRDIEGIELDYIKKGVDVTLPLLKEAVRSHLSPSAKLVDFGNEVVTQSERNILTKQNYKTLFNNLERYKPGTLVTDIDYQFVVSYDKWLRDSGIAHNTRISRLRLLRAVLNEAKNRDIISTNPFERFKIQQMVSKKGYITREQLRQLEAMKLKGYDDIVRDAFLVGCYTGLRFSDVTALRQEHIADGWLVIGMKKTKFTVEIPVATLFDGKLLGLVEKYGGNIGRLTKKLGSNSVVNKTLRPLLDAVGADAKTTFHSSRHTFATLLGQQGVDITVVSKLLGHQKLQTTQIYREVDRQGILQAVGSRA